jgi:hypothetical protein
MKVSVPLIHQLRDQLWVLRESQLLRTVGVKSLLFFLELSVTKYFIVAGYFKITSLCHRPLLIIKVVTSEVVHDLCDRDDTV